MHFFKEVYCMVNNFFVKLSKKGGGWTEYSPDPPHNKGRYPSIPPSVNFAGSKYSAI